MPVTQRQKVLSVVAPLAIGAVLVGLYLGQSEPPEPEPPVPASPEKRIAAPRVESTSSQAKSTSPRPGMEEESVPGQRSGSEMLEEWLSSSTDSDRVGITIMQNFFLLPEKDHATAMAQLINLVRDPSISGLERILLDPRTSLEAKEILFGDVKIRPYEVKLPIFLVLMQKADHPHAKDAHDILSSILGDDWGTDYVRWQKEIERAVKEQG